MSVGLSLSLMVLLIVAIQFGTNKFIRKVTNCYFFWLAIGIFYLVWLIVFRFQYDWKTLYDAYVMGKMTDPSSMAQSTTISNALLCNFCPLCALILPITLIVDPSRKAARAISPIALTGGIITLFMVRSDSTAAWTLQYIFIGSLGKRLYFFMHAMNVILSVGVLLNTPKFNSKGATAFYATATTLFIYVLIVRAATGMAWNCNGLSVNDFSEKGYLHALQKGTHIPAYVCPYIWVIVLYIVNIGIVHLKDYVFERFYWFRYGNAKNQATFTYTIKNKSKTVRKWWFWYDYNNYEFNEPFLLKNHNKALKKYKIDIARTNKFKNKWQKESI